MAQGSNRPVAAPFDSLRGWLDHLAARERLSVIRAGVPLKFELAAIAKHFDGTQATLFPHPDGHAVPVVSGLLSDRGWMADALGVPQSALVARFQAAVENPTSWA